jgi:hypothetical protein
MYKKITEFQAGDKLLTLGGTVITLLRFGTRKSKETVKIISVYIDENGKEIFIENIEAFKIQMKKI